MAILFGSFARNEESPNDIDVAVRLNPESGDAHESAGWGFDGPRLRNQLQSLISLRVQVELYDPVNMSAKVLSGVRADGIVIYDQNLE